jgi:hypothetical protein
MMRLTFMLLTRKCPVRPNSTRNRRYTPNGSRVEQQGNWRSAFKWNFGRENPRMQHLN